MKVLIHPWFYFALILAGLVNIAAPALHWSQVIVWPLTFVVGFMPMLAALAPHVFEDWAIKVPAPVINEAVIAFAAVGMLFTVLARALPTSPYTYSWVLPAALTVVYSLFTGLSNQLKADEAAASSVVAKPVVPPVTPAPPPPTPAP